MHRVYRRRIEAGWRSCAHPVPDLRRRVAANYRQLSASPVGMPCDRPLPCDVGHGRRAPDACDNRRGSDRYNVRPSSVGAGQMEKLISTEMMAISRPCAYVIDDGTQDYNIEKIL